MYPTGDHYTAPRRKRGPKGQPFRNVLQMGSLFGRLHYYHPTKGWRFRRAAPMRLAFLPRKA